ncbi:MAG TPA: agmatine deiminase family protein, partial [Candidatus Kapabacteria bacterium]|nr:agmatine deiminase family protein [Candidatus Kapabacteria bacterium]
MTFKAGKPTEVTPRMREIAEELHKEIEENRNFTVSKANTIIVSALLEMKFPQVFRELKAIVEGSGAIFVALGGTRDIWCRDYFPIQTERGKFFSYIYDPDYLQDDPGLVTREINYDFGEAEVLPLNIKLDGGNVMKGPGFVLLTEKVFRENRAEDARSRNRLLVFLESAFGKAVIFPNEPNDPVGHVDGEVMLVDDVLFVNDYSEYINDPIYAKFVKELKSVIATLVAQGRVSRVMELPYKLLNPESKWS